ncbi:ATP-binding cassette glutathione S-conjugate transporter ycf1 [Coemansia brasiliensis]|uniref:ATP-binding cassette glutathione S-conjugate transporter ycf1 n=1 Tax=Coemansia brasiliensis TaxID=2650707 RepID=A0A9W8IA09_9FUNG|nr:ATP-binding cassette glutathione S-conjugate transporter ycf1 [Coemansia brasiliensis]
MVNGTIFETLATVNRTTTQAVLYVCSLITLLHAAGLDSHLSSKVASNATSLQHVSQTGIVAGLTTVVTFLFVWPLGSIQLQSKKANKAVSSIVHHLTDAWTTLREYYRGSLYKLWIQLTFARERELIQRQRKGKLTADDIPELPEDNRIIYQGLKYDVNEKLFLLRAIYQAVWPSLVPLYFADLLVEGIDMANIMVDGYVMHCLDAPDQHKWHQGYSAALLLLFLKLLQSKTRHIINRSDAGWQQVSDALEQEFLRLPLSSDGLRRIGSISTETYLAHSLISKMKGIHNVLVSISVIAASAWSIYRQVGWLAFVPFLIHSGTSLINTTCIWVFGAQSDWEDDDEEDDYDYYDEDLDDISDTIRTVKLFGWESKYLETQPKQRWQQRYGQLPWYAPAMRCLWFIIDSIDIIASQLSAGIITYTYAKQAGSAGKRITNAEVFQINQLAENMRWDIEGIIPQLRSLHILIRSYYMVENFLRGDFVPTLPRAPISDQQKPEVVLNDCAFIRNKKQRQQPVLDGVSFSAQAGEIVSVVGRTGSGKSTLLLSICGELEMVRGSGKVCGSVAYLEQDLWIMNDTMRANILFGRPMDGQFYEQVIYACALSKDLAGWPQGDLTVIGSKGINISGGQRARLALARTLYSRADIYLLDDPLSAVDAHVKRHIMEHVLLDSGLLKGKLRIVSTHTKQILPFSHQIVTLDEGKSSVQQQTPQIYRPVASADFNPSVSPSQHEPEKVNIKDSDEKAEKPDHKNAQKWSLRENLHYAAHLCGLPMIAGIVTAGLVSPVITFVMNGYVLSALQADKNSAGSSIQSTLHYLFLSMVSAVVERVMCRMQNQVNRRLVNKYMDNRIKRVFVKSVIWAPLSFFDSVTQSQISAAFNKGVRNFSGNIISLLMHQTRTVVNVLLSIYRMCTNSPQLLIVIPLATWLQSKERKVVDHMMDPIFDIEDEMMIRHQPVEDIIASNKHMIRIFNVGPYYLRKYQENSKEKRKFQMARSGISELGNTLYVVLTNATDMVIMWMLLVQYHITGSNISAAEYLHFSQMASTLISEFRQLKSFPRKLRSFSKSANVFRQYLSIKPEGLNATASPPANWPSSGEIVFKDFKLKYREDLEPALNGINLKVRPGEKIGIVGRTGAGKSTLAKSLFRLHTGLTSGSITIDGVDIDKLNVRQLRPCLGIIPQESTMFSGTLRENLDPLNQFTIEDMWGAMIECNMAKIVSQRSKTFSEDSDSEDDDDGNDSGTDDGYDSDGRVIDDFYDIKKRRRKWKRAGALKRILLYLLDEMPEPKSRRVRPRRHVLDRDISNSTGTLSSGQQQMFSLCRLLMRRRKIVVLDEATADVDLDTDKDIHNLIHTRFGDCTILTIAHRLETVMKSDRIVVMNQGQIVEVGPPQELAQQNGYFAELIRNNDFGQSVF